MSEQAWSRLGRVLLFTSGFLWGAHVGKSAGK